MKLYYSPGACSLAPHIVFEELGVEYLLELVPVSEGKTQSAEYRRINPKGLVPALRVGRRILTEAPAILLYLGMSAPERQLLPLDPDGLARCAEWFNWLSATVHAMAFGQLWRPLRFSDDRAHHRAIQDRGRRNISDAFASIEEKLEGQTFAIGDHYCVLDPYILVYFRWGNRIGIDMKREYPHWTRHALRVLERPAVTRSLEQEGISIWE